ncbi:MAG: TlpA disulfide reductase family protein [Thermoanaerobaculia bacterium]
MNEFIGNHIHFIIDWGQAVALSVGFLAVALIYRIVRGNRFLLPKGFFGWFGSLLLLPLVLLSGLVLARITVMKPGALVILNRLDEIKGQTAPALSYRLVRDDEGESINDLQGKVVLLNFWATWCLPCRKEMPELDRLQREHSTTDLIVLTLSDETRDKLIAYDEEHQYAMRSGYLQEFPWVNMGSDRPVTFLIDRTGVVRDYFTGPWDFDFFSGKIQAYL